MNKKGKQLELPLPRLGAAERKAWIRHRLAGLEYRQNARLARRQASYQRRRDREAGLLVAPARPEQLPLPETNQDKVLPPPAKQLPLPIAPFWSL
jgi:hypothetical protein